MGSKKAYYRWQLAPTTCNIESDKEQMQNVESDKDQPQKDFYYIVKDCSIGDRVLRSNIKTGQQKEYLIKSYGDLEFQNWVGKSEILKLKNEGLLSNIDKWEL